MSSRVPRATYRVQLHAGFTLDDAVSLVPYLDRLGVSHLYCSPYLQARAGSMHGYDVVDHHAISSELGGEQALDRLVAALSERDMGHIVDVVSNHMTIAERANRWWWAVLRDGPSSEFASFFDIDWDPGTEKLSRQVLIAILGDHYGRVLSRGELALEVDNGEVILRYHEHQLPVAPGSVAEMQRDGESLEDFAGRVTTDVDSLHQLLERQHYRLAYWKTAGRELNYRRFFAINDLVALRMENRTIFDEVHGLVLSLVRERKLDGLRVDHIDGLREPEAYLRHLRREAPDAYIVVEKILEPSELLPATWPIEGTTGYDFLNLVAGLFVDATGEKPLTDLYARVTGESTDLAELMRDKKLQLMRTELATDLDRLTDLFTHVCERHRDHRDYTRPELRAALAETIAALPVYRTYVSGTTGSVTAEDERWITDATELARDRRRDLEGELFRFLRDLLLLRVAGETEVELALRFQQLSGPVMAKGVEDTLFYGFNRFVALNEVGGDPGRFGVSVDDFHRAMSRAQAEWPHSMLATSTHDTKRAEDVRARLSVLSEMPERWAEALERWSEAAARHRRDEFPDRNAEYLLWQILVGTWEPGGDESWSARIAEYMTKATREAKVHTSWIDPNAGYDDALRTFVEGVMNDMPLMADVARFASALVEPGWTNSLAQTLIKLTAPGVPDIYQGQESWDLSLVDPDNRRPVDYETRRALLDEVDDTGPEGVWGDRAAGGLPKMFVTRTALSVRASDPDAFTGTYDPVPVSGSKSAHVVAFARSARYVTVAPRLVVGLANDWDDTRLELPGTRWTNVLTAEDVIGPAADLARLLRRFPVALLKRREDGP
ncbi:MAG: malto-oligosyltrehalose synthase [Actinomycetota bacterium]|nr:malto-oligosyltrehalose synthase [Actinomycetota bacterium]